MENEEKFQHIGYFEIINDLKKENKRSMKYSFFRKNF